MSSLSQRPNAILLDVIPPRMEKDVAARRLAELESLTTTFGGVIVVRVIQKRSLPDYQTYVGSGKLQEIIEMGKREHADILIVNNLLKAKQMFTLGEKLRPHKMVVWDRVDLILKIFQKHAKTAEAKLQIKLAAIHHMGPRIFGMGMEMMQQAGGTGTRGGQGETNTEMMKRHLADQERRIKKDLEDAARSRRVHRERRSKLGMKTASIVGYTNAGKSSLLNALTGKGAYVANKLFATLDTRVSKLWLPQSKMEVLLSDTIGFIQDLPPELVSAFRSTLDETVDADLLLHVIDIGDMHMADKITEVDAILKSLGVDTTPTILVFNKIDTITNRSHDWLLERYADKSPVFVSAATGDGLEELKETIARRIKSSQGAVNR
jgi:GTP-binding protein HflX